MLKRNFKKKISAHEKLRYKKYVLYQFLEDINKFLLSDDNIDIIKEVFVKELKPLKPEEETNEEDENLSFSKGRRSKTKAKKKNEQNEGFKIFYGIFNSDIKIKRYLEVFREDIKRSNLIKKKDRFSVVEDNDKPLFSPNESSNLNASTRSNLYINDYNPKKKEKLTEEQTNIAIHTTHYQNLVRKILFEKFQKMRIWVRQCYSQNNKNIYLHCKLQGKHNFQTTN
jgi:hypothetical protein